MEKNYILQELIRKGVAIVCYNSGEVVKLGDWVEVLYPGCGFCIKAYKKNVTAEEFDGKIAIRLEEWHGSLDYGWDRPSYYIMRGLAVVNFSELNCDFGEFKTNDVGINGLIFGG